MMNANPTITTTDWTRNDGAQSTLKQPTLNELLAITFEERQYSRPPQLIWLCMGGYRRSRFAAPHMSAFGTKRTYRDVRCLSAFGGKRTEPKRDAMSAVDPKRTLRGLKSRSAAVGSVVSSLHCMNDPQPEGHMASYIGRRKFLATLGVAAAWPLAAVKLPRRRQFLHLAAGAAALPAMSRVARAQAYPTRPVRIIVGYPPGGTADVVARLIGQQLSERLGQPFVVENRPGAGTNIATETVVKSAPDGYTLLVVDASPAINTTLYHNLSFFFFRDIAPVACVISVPLFMVVNPAVPAKTVPEFIAYAKANPRKVNMASNGNGGLLHLAGELFKIMTGVDLVHVPYRGAQPALTDLISGQVQVMFVASTVEYIKTGKVRALAVTTPTRSEVLPDVPPLSEFVPGYDAAAWIGVGAPKNTPLEIIDKLNKEVNAALADPKLKLRLADLGSSVAGGSAADYGRRLEEEAEKWGKVIRAANIKAE